MDIQPAVVPLGRAGRSEPVGASVARDLTSGPFPAVNFYGTQNQASSIRSDGTRWCRENSPGSRVSVYRTSPMDNPVGRAGHWEAVLVDDMENQVSPATAGDAPSRPGPRAGTASAARGDAPTENNQEDA